VRTRCAADTCRSRQKPSLHLQHSSCHRGIRRQADSTCGERQSADREALSSSKKLLPINVLDDFSIILIRASTERRTGRGIVSVLVRGPASSPGPRLLRALSVRLRCFPITRRIPSCSSLPVLASPSC
jgi:hypothetical protein